MTQEEKLQLAKEWYNNPSVTEEVKAHLEELFPELKESEDGRIKKFIINHLHGHLDTCKRFVSDGMFPPFSGTEIKMFEASIAWLKKQGNESVTIALTKAGLKTYKDGNKWCILAGDNIQDGICGFGDTVDEALFEFLKELIEILKIKPKFKVGDWVVNNETGTVHQVEGLVKLNCGYAYNLTDGGYISSFKFDEYRLWTIQDAKDGDVLCIHSSESDYDCVFLYKNIDEIEPNKNVAVAYCCIDVYENKIEFGIQGPDYIDIRKIKPATIEQGELLIKTMNEAGYVWDFEHKELKQIKRNTAWSEEDEKNLQSIIDEIEADKRSAPGYNLATYDRFLYWLESLEERYFKPTDEQIIALRWVLTNIPYCRHKEEISGLLDQIKNL